jgi:hypothetical protein
VAELPIDMDIHFVNIVEQLPNGYLLAVRLFVVLFIVLFLFVRVRLDIHIFIVHIESELEIVVRIAARPIFIEIPGSSHNRVRRLILRFKQKPGSRLLIAGMSAILYREVSPFGASL